MNIAPSPDPTSMPARGDSSAAGAFSAKDCDTTPFADLLGTSPEHLPDGTPEPANADAKAQPRRQAEDGTDPALTILLPFMLTQVAQALPTPTQTPDMSQAASTSGVMDAVACGAPGAAVVPKANADVAGGSVVSEKSPGVALVPASSASDATVALQSAPVASRIADPAPDAAGASVISSTVAKVASSLTPASEMQPVQAGLPAVGAPAEISSSMGQALANPVSTVVVSESANGISQRQSQHVSDAASAGEADGTTAAMQQLTMKDQSPERQTRTVANIAAVASAPGKQRVAGMPEKSSEVRVSESAPTTPTIAGMTFEPQAGRGQVSEAPTANEPTAASEITRQTFDLIERVRVTGRDNAEVRMLLNDGQQVTVSLRLERGEWKPVFKTESEALCRALEQNWNRAVAQPGPQSVKFGTPVFESQSSQSDLGTSPRQQSESGGRERSFNRREEEPTFENSVPFRSTSKPARATHASRFSEAAAMQVYA